jgi:uncharacterized membrane protein HdeD (DUF308 family)
MSINQPPAAQLPADFAASLHRHWKMFLVEGIILVVLGMAAIALPVIATLALALVLGWLLLISGVIGLITTFWMRQAPGFAWSLVSAVLAIAAGIVLLGWPVSGAVSLTLVLIVFFVIEGVASIMLAIEHRKSLSGRWGWLMASGIVDIVLAGMIMAGLPGTALWALGLLVGINMIFGGTSLIAMALHARDLSQSPAAPTTRTGV